jgi:hypothetical protein
MCSFILRSPDARFLGIVLFGATAAIKACERDFGEAAAPRFTDGRRYITLFERLSKIKLF